ncbi:hypothetical protein Tco_1332465, partial [Tanacetum coccineum]
FLLLVYINAAKLMLILLGSVNAVRHMLMLPVQVPAAEETLTQFSSLIIKIIIMSSPKFAEMHNVVAFLEKPIESDGFAKIIDFLKASSVHYALIDLVDKKRVIITESSIRCDLHLEDAGRSDLQLEDAGGTDCLPTTTIFEDTWIRMLGNMSNHKKIFVNPSHTKKVFANMKRAGKDFSGRITPLFDTMMVQASEERLERKKKSRTTGLRRLKKVGMSSRVGSSEDQESLCDHEDASKQGRNIEDIDADTEFWIDDEVFVDVTTVEKEEQSTKIGEAVTTAGVEDSAAPTCEAVTTAGVEDSAAPTIPTTIEETLAQTLMEIKAAKPKAKGIVFHDQEEQVSVSKPTVSVTQPSVKDKGKGIIQEPERPLIRKEQVALDEQMARDIQAQLDAEIIEEERLERQKQEEANIALIESWENTQAMMEADRLLAERLQTREREELTDEEKGKLFMELMEKRRKHFAELRAQEKVKP